MKMTTKRFGAFCVPGLLFCLIILFLLGCASSTYEIAQTTACSNMFFQPFMGTCPVNDTVLLEEGLTQEYSLQSLREYFSKHHQNGFSEDRAEPIYYSQIQEQFPIEVTRSEGYTVYKVSEGGYYYLFWACSATLDTDPILIYSTYIGKTKEPTVFSTLGANKSTAQDLAEIDPYFDLRLDMSYSMCSFSYCTPNSLVRVSYARTEGPVDSLDDLTVTEIAVVERSATPSRFSLIRTEDFPKE